MVTLQIINKRNPNKKLCRIKEALMKMLEDTAPINPLKQFIPHLIMKYFEGNLEVGPVAGEKSFMGITYDEA